MSCRPTESNILCMQLGSLKEREKFWKTNETVTEMVEEEDPELTSSHRCTEITTNFRAIMDENDLKTSRRDFPQLNI